MNLKVLGIILIMAIVVNLILFVFGALSQFWFWIIVILIAFVAYKILPKLKDK
jgi:hypothetical protein|tara:strand:- start:1136 stop:1294 length:159 start_codon:yes stop_codon:yes gene_type:complete